MEANKVTKSHKPLSDGGMAKEEFIRVGTNALQDCGATEIKRWICKETYPLEQ